MAAKRTKPEKSKKDKNKKPEKSKSNKAIRDSFTMPENDYILIKELKQRCLELGVHVKKSELLRSGLHALHEMTDEQLTEMAGRIDKIKTGRPANSG